MQLYEQHNVKTDTTPTDFSSEVPAKQGPTIAPTISTTLPIATKPTPTLTPTEKMNLVVIQIPFAHPYVSTAIAVPMLQEKGTTKFTYFPKVGQ